MEHIFDKFLAEMTPDDRFRLLETLMPRFLEGIEKKELVSYVLKLLRNDLEEEMKNLSLREKVTMVANETGETISALLPLRIRRILTPHRQEKAEEDVLSQEHPPNYGVSSRSA